MRLVRVTPVMSSSHCAIEVPTSTSFSKHCTNIHVRACAALLIDSSETVDGVMNQNNEVEREHPHPAGAIK